jgi:hypothetical protein
MVNPIVSPGEDAHPTRALASITSPTQQSSSHHERPDPRPMIDLTDNCEPPHSSTPTPSPHDDLPIQFLTHDCQQSPMLDPWRSALRRAGMRHLDRLYVVADGSCAGGSVVRAFADSTLGAVPLAEARDPRKVRAFRCEFLASLIERWTPEQWETLVPNEIREEVLDHRLRRRCSCQQSTPCHGVCDWRRPWDASEERDLLVSLLRQLTYSIGAIFFHFVALGLQTGVLLLVSDQRHPENHSYQVFDFGTSEYPKSMIIQSIFLPSAHPDSHGVGHYETLGLPDTGTSNTHMTLFSRDCPILPALRQFSGQPAPSDGAPITYHCYPAMSLPDPQPSSPASARHSSSPDNADLPQPATPQWSQPLILRGRIASEHRQNDFVRRPRYSIRRSPRELCLTRLLPRLSPHLSEPSPLRL